MKVVHVLGQGGFGCVKLVKYPRLPKQSFALKSIRKARVIQTGQQEHVVAEKDIMAAMDSPFVAKFYRY